MAIHVMVDMVIMLIQNTSIAKMRHKIIPFYTVSFVPFSFKNPDPFTSFRYKKDLKNPLENTS